jgi:uncharacterized protein
MKHRKRTILAVAAVLVLVFWLASSALVAWKQTRRARDPFPEPPPKVAWGNVEPHRLKTSDGQEIGSWLVRGDRRKACVLLLHGNNESRGGQLPLMQLLAESGYTAMAITFRARGDSTGEVNDFGWSARHDVVTAAEFLHKEFPGQSLFIVGRSFGAAAAIFAAEELDGKVAGYFLEQPYKDLKSAVWNRLQHHLPPGFDWAAYAGLRLWATVLLPENLDRISPFDHIGDIPASVPIVIAGGTADRHAPISEVRNLFDRVQDHATLVVFEGAEHVPLNRYDPALYRTSLFRLLERESFQESGK